MHTSSALFESGLSIPSLTLSPFGRIRVSGPHDDLDRIFEELIKIHDFPYGKTDHGDWKKS